MTAANAPVVLLQQMNIIHFFKTSRPPLVDVHIIYTVDTLNKTIQTLHKRALHYRS